MCWQRLERNRSPSPTPAGGPVAKPEITRSGMGHPLSARRETWLAPNVQSSSGTRHLPPAIPDSEFGDSELGPLGIRYMLRNATFFGFFENFENQASTQAIN